LLDKRGNQIVAGQMKLVIKTEDKIIELIENKFDEFTRPVAAYVVFKSQENYERCIEKLETS
jgi:hypothetical protein